MTDFLNDRNESDVTMALGLALLGGLLAGFGNEMGKRLGEKASDYINIT